MPKVFQSVNPLIWVTFSTSIVFIFLLGYYPNVLPLEYFGAIGQFFLGLAKNYRTIILLVFWSIVIAHVCEAIIARRICQELRLDQQSTVLWMIQTFVLGFPSLTLLRKNKIS